ncbi:MAG: bL21 family ribosomal protein [Planctomycetes bacterium]|nr:bL21 family ribosomal protein [Planctomycetota bacterium]
MYAIIQTGGKQYRVEKGVRIQVEKLSGRISLSISSRHFLQRTSILNLVQKYW